MPNKKEPLSLITIKTLLAVIIFTGVGTIIVGGGWLIGKQNRISSLLDGSTVKKETANKTDDKSQTIKILLPKEGEQWHIGEINTIEISRPIKNFYPFTHLTLNNKEGKEIGIISCKIGGSKTNIFKWDTRILLNYCGVSLEEKNKKVEPGIYKIALTKDTKGRPVIATSELFSITNNVISEETNPKENEVAFDNCGKLQEYKGEKWYNNFIDIIKKIDRLNYYEAKKIYDINKQYGSYNSIEDVILKFGKVSPEDISDACLSTNNKYFLAIVAGQYGGSGFKLLKFDTEDSKIVTAKREDIDGGKDTAWYKKTDENYKKNAESQKEEMYLWFVTPSEFGKREGSKIIMTGKSGDAGCSAESTFEYDLKQNYVSIVKKCSWCEGDNEKRCVVY